MADRGFLSIAFHYCRAFGFSGHKFTRDIKTLPEGMDEFSGCVGLADDAPNSNYFIFFGDNADKFIDEVIRQRHPGY